MKYVYVIYNGGIWHHVDAVNVSDALRGLKLRGVKIIGDYKVFNLVESGHVGVKPTTVFVGTVDTSKK